MYAVALLTAAGAAEIGADVVAQTAARAELEPGQRSAEAARAALRRQPLDVAALRDLALAEGADSAAGRRLLQLGDQVSRREPATQLLLLEANAQGGDSAAALRHYDALLSTVPALRQELLGILARALAEPEIQEQLLRYADRPWFLALIEAAAKPSAAGAGSATRAVALAGRAGLLTQPESRDRLAPRLIGALTLEGRLSEARALAAATGNRGWMALGFSAASLDERLGLFAWQLSQTPAVSSEWRAPGTLAIAVEPGRRAQVAARITSLTAGAYRLSLHLAVPSEPGAASEWRIACHGVGGAKIALSPMPAPVEPTMLTVRLVVPAGCPFQDWSLWAEGADAQAPSQVLLSRLEVAAE